MIPKLLHIVWIGNPDKRPDECIDSWRKLNPDYEVRVWGNDDLKARPWVNAKHMMAMAHHSLAGVADMMRYEILYYEGGITLDADAQCVRPLEPWFHEPSEWAVWENEHIRPGLISNGHLGSVPRSPFFGQVVEDINDKASVVDQAAWLTVGPRALTQTWNTHHYPLTIFPSHFFMPEHYTGMVYEGTGPVFAHQLWMDAHAHLAAQAHAEAEVAAAQQPASV